MAKKRSDHLSNLEKQFESQTRRFSTFDMLGIPNNGDTIESQTTSQANVEHSAISAMDHAPSPVSDHSQSLPLPGKISEQVYEIPLDQLVTSPDQPRTISDADADQELLESIRQQGVLNPIQVRKVENKFEVIAGERRWRACQLLGKSTIPALIRDTSNDQAAAQALIDNLVRKDLSPLDEARAFQSLLQKHGYQQNQLADRVGCHKSRISRALSMLRLPAQVLDILFAHGNEMTSRHAEALLPLMNQPAKMERIARLAAEQRWTSERIRTEVERKPRFNQGSQCIRVTLRGENGSRGVVAAIRWSPNQQDKVESVREGIQQILKVLDTYGNR